MMRPVLALGLLAMSLGAAEPSTPAVLKIVSFEVAQDAEVVASVNAGCAGCDWGRAGREAAVLRLEVDGAYSQHLFLTRGAAAADYKILLGPLGKGAHSLKISLDRRASAKTIANAEVTNVAVNFSHVSDPEHDAVALAPVLYARPNTIGRFTDVPLLMWYEKETTVRGFRFRYSVVFSNEDGGTPADRLLATWGRLTDLEYVYGIEFDRDGKVITWNSHAENLFGYPAEQALGREIAELIVPPAFRERHRHLGTSDPHAETAVATKCVKQRSPAAEGECGRGAELHGS